MLFEHTISELPLPRLNRIRTTSSFVDGSVTLTSVRQFDQNSATSILTLTQNSPRFELKMTQNDPLLEALAVPNDLSVSGTLERRKLDMVAKIDGEKFNLRGKYTQNPLGLEIMSDNGEITFSADIGENDGKIILLSSAGELARDLKFTYSWPDSVILNLDGKIAKYSHSSQACDLFISREIFGNEIRLVLSHGLTPTKIANLDISFDDMSAKLGLENPKPMNYRVFTEVLYGNITTGGDVSIETDIDSSKISFSRSIDHSEVTSGHIQVNHFFKRLTDFEFSIHAQLKKDKFFAGFSGKKKSIGWKVDAGKPKYAKITWETGFTDVDGLTRRAVGIVQNVFSAMEDLTIELVSGENILRLDTPVGFLSYEMVESESIALQVGCLIYRH